MRSYFKVKSGQLFFFENTIPESIQNAYDQAMALGKPVSIYAVAKCPGPWDKLAIIGHRSRAVLLDELSRTKDTTDSFFLQEELVAIARCYERAGRMAPMMVAA